MMKNMKKQDGYVLVYVLVVVLVIGIIAVSALTAAGRNLNSQAAAVKYTQDKYEAEGAIELFVSELQAASIDYVEGLNGAPVSPTAFSQKINHIIDSDAAPIDETNDELHKSVLQILGETYENDEYRFVLTDLNVETEEDTSKEFNEHIKTPENFVARFEKTIIENSQPAAPNFYTNNNEENLIEEGNAYFYLNATAIFGTVQVSADMRLSFAVEKFEEAEQSLAKVQGVAFEYMTYEVSTAKVESEGTK